MNIIKKFTQLIMIGMISGAVLAEFLRLLYLTTGITAYNLLFNFDYIPIIGEFSDTAGWTGMAFHYLMCIGSVIVSYYIFKIYNVEKEILPYVSLFFIGSLILYFLTELSPKQPEWNDWQAFVSFGGAHLLYGMVVGLLVKKIIDNEIVKRHLYRV